MTPTMHIKLAETDAEIASCYPVMHQLRPHLSRQSFLERVRRQMGEGYRLALLEESGLPAAVAGFRVCENLAWGRFLYVDDLVSLDARRSRGLGKRLLSWLYAQAREQGCAELHLDSGLQRKGAHRFYEREGVEVIGLPFRSFIESGVKSDR
jgi:GNAT superfamily N-acetyltransferase